MQPFRTEIFSAIEVGYSMLGSSSADELQAAARARLDQCDKPIQLQENHLVDPAFSVFANFFESAV
jgi:hypothetical protein